MGNLSDVLSYEDAIASLLANSNYRANGSTSECETLIAACDVLLILRPRSAQFGGTAGEQVQFDHQAVVQVRDAAEKWLKSENAKSYYETHSIGYINTGYIQE